MKAQTITITVELDTRPFVESVRSLARQVEQVADIVDKSRAAAREFDESAARVEATLGQTLPDPEPAEVWPSGQPGEPSLTFYIYGPDPEPAA